MSFFAILFPSRPFWPGVTQQPVPSNTVHTHQESPVAQPAAAHSSTQQRPVPPPVIIATTPTNTEKQVSPKTNRYNQQANQIVDKIAKIIGHDDSWTIKLSKMAGAVSNIEDLRSFAHTIVTRSPHLVGNDPVILQLSTAHKRMQDKTSEHKDTAKRLAQRCHEMVHGTTYRRLVEHANSVVTAQDLDNFKRRIPSRARARLGIR